MSKLIVALGALVIAVFAVLANGHGNPGSVSSSQLPLEAHGVLAQIKRGGSFAYPQDGGVFGNRERLLPSQPNGYYREYTVPTPGSRDRGARRIISGGSPPSEFFYTDNHYSSFSRIRE